MSETFTPPPRVVEELPAQRSHRRYPWEEWADGKTREFVRGVHFDGPAGNFTHAAHSWADRKGLKPQYRTVGGNVLMRFVPKSQKSTVGLR